MKKALTIDELYHQVKDYDTVVTADASLADALNRRLDRPVIGNFADTPKRLAAEEDYETKREIFLKLANHTDLSWKQASYGLNKTLEAWKHTGRKEGVLEYEDNDIFYKTVDFLEDWDTSFHRIEGFSLQGKVAVINFYQFNELDKKILPKEYDKISMLTDKTTEFSNFNIFESGLDIIKSLIENIERVGAENSAVVVRPDSKYQNLLESYLRSEEIDFTFQKGVSESENLRAFLNLLETGESDSRIRIRDARPVAEALGINLKGEKSYLDSKEGLDDFKEFLNVVQFLKFREVLERFEEFSGRKHSEIELILEELELLEKEVSEHNINRVKYFLRNYDISVEEQSRGVLLADPEQATVVDRPVVFYIGMSSDWNSKSPENDWIKRDKWEESRIKDFQLLIQNGVKQVYMVEDRKMEEEIKPSFHFDEIIGENISSFTQLPHEFKASKNSKNPQKFDKKSIEKTEINHLSQSGLNSLAQSPRLFYMSQLISEADDEKLKKGLLFHDFAELYFNNPEIEEKLDKVKEIFIEEMREVSDDISLNQLETELDHGLKNLIKFIEGKGFSGNGYKTGSEENIFAEALEIDFEASSTEMYFKNNDKRIKGKIDLIKDPHHLVDFKSGRKKSRKEVVKSTRVETFEDSKFPDFQTLMYLSHHSENVKGPIKFTYFYFLSDLGDSLVGKDSETKTEITFYLKTFQEKASETELYEYLIKDVKKSNDRRRTLEALGYTGYRDFIQENKIPRVFDKEDFKETEFASKFIERCIEAKGDYKYVKKGAETALNKIVEYRNTNLFQDDVESFGEFVEEKISEIQDYEESGYPVKEKASELPMEDLIIE